MKSESFLTTSVMAISQNIQMQDHFYKNKRGKSVIGPTKNDDKSESEKSLVQIGSQSLEDHGRLQNISFSNPPQAMPPFCRQSTLNLTNQAYVSIEEEDKEDAATPIAAQYKKQTSLKPGRRESLSPYNNLHEISLGSQNSSKKEV